MRRSHLLAGRPQPGGREPAPGALALVQDLVNTVDREHGPDLLDDARGLREWLDHRGLAAEGVSARDLRHARELREALRGLLLANNGAAEPPPGARAVLEAAAARARLTVRLPAEGAALTPVSPGVDGALGTVVAAAEGLPARGLPLGVLRPLTERQRELVRDVDLRQPGEGERLLPAKKGWNGLSGEVMSQR